MKTKPLISSELAGFLVSGLSLTVATRDAALQPDGARVWAARISRDRTELTLFLYRPAAAATLRNLESQPEIAICVDRPSDSRACQVKGLYVSSRPARATERAEVQRQADAFLTGLEAIGIPRTMTGGWRWWPAVAVQMRITELFEQTPGPGAGDPLPADAGLPGGPAVPQAAP